MNKKICARSRHCSNVISRLLILAMLLAPLLSCQTVDAPVEGAETGRLAIVSHLDSGFAVSASKNTISWKPDSSFIHANDRIDAESYRRLLEDAVVVTLKNKGYAFSDDPQQGDLLVSYAAGLETELSDSEVTLRFGMMPGLQGKTPDQDQYEKGTIIVDIFDKSANKSIWRGVVQGFADLQLSPVERSERLKGVMQQLLAEFPAML